MNFYNEIDPFCAQWLRNLIDAGLIPDGVVDERSIEDIAPVELAGITQFHAFAGLGGWPLALRQARIPDNYPLWTGSCPCQPFSTAGKGGGFADERHLWPAFDWLIGQCRPPIIVGEQVDAAIRTGWWDLVGHDLEGHGYAVAGAVFPASAVGAPQIRHRFYFVAVHQSMSEMRDGFASNLLLRREEVERRTEADLQSVRQETLSEASILADREGPDSAPPKEARDVCAPSRSWTSEAAQRSQDSGLESQSPSDQSSGLFGWSRSNEGQESWPSVRSRPPCDGDSEKDRLGRLRDDRDKTPSVWRQEDVRHAVDRPDHSGERLRPLEHSDHLPRNELRPWELGRGDASVDGHSMDEGEVDGCVNSVEAQGEDSDQPCGEVSSGDPGVGAPQIRHRTYWVARADENGCGWQQTPWLHGRRDGARRDKSAAGDTDWSSWDDALGRGEPSGLARADEGQCGRLAGSGGSKPDGQARGWQQGDGGASGDCEAGGVALSDEQGSGGRGIQRPGEGAGEGVGAARERLAGLCQAGTPGPVNGFWRDSDWLYCRDDKWRPVEPGTFPLASGAPARVGRLRAYGNAICVPQAQAFIEAVMSA